jgi:hypothetical protein
MQAQKGVSPDKKRRQSPAFVIYKNKNGRGQMRNTSKERENSQLFPVFQKKRKKYKKKSKKFSKHY